MTTNLQSAAKAVWWMVLLRGILTAIFGIIALVSPGIALLALVFVFGIYAIIDGVVAVAYGIRARATEPHWVWAIVQGVISVLAGIVALVWPGITALTLLIVIGIWAIMLGIAEIVEAFGARKRGSDTWGWTLALGIVNIIFGILLLAQPGAGILALLWLVGVFSLIGGVVLIVWAFRVRNAVHEATSDTRASDTRANDTEANDKAASDGS